MAAVIASRLRRQLAGSALMIDEFAKEYLHGELRDARRAVLWKLDGLGEYDVRRPLTGTGTNLLGLVKHLSVWEARYFGEVFGRPFPEPLARWDGSESRGADLWATEQETREEITNLYRRVWEHSDATITEPRHRLAWPCAVVAAPRRDAVQRPRPHAHRDEPARRARRHPARATRRGDRDRTLGRR